ncbi:MAG: response regulator [Nitrososphaera sp.]|nr:response regulator [Nitrososphaera sp.]
MSVSKEFRILVVDDEPDITTVMKMGLEQVGFNVDTFNNPMEAIDHFKEGIYDLVLLDIKMSPINGFELYRKLLEIDNKVKVCFITAFEIYYEEFRRVFPKIHVDCFVRKPVRLDKLAKIISTELERTEERISSR